jgi:hypothetical protein
MNEQQKAALWRMAESNMARRERFRYIREGRIVPAHRMQPQLMVRNPNAKGGWSPQIGGVS